jgi:hypothetical protein
MRSTLRCPFLELSFCKVDPLYENNQHHHDREVSVKQ